MNKVYRVIWNESLGAWVAVSELSKSKAKSSKTRTIGSVIAAGLMLTFSAGAIAAGAPMTTCTPLDIASIFNSNSLFGQNIVCAWNTTNSTLVGNNITAAGNGVNLVAVGNNISTGGERSTVLGSEIIHSGRFTTVIGQNINSRTEHSIVMGEDTTIDGGNYDISIGGNQNILNSQHTVALGNNINTSGSINSLAAGDDTTITNSRLATAVGDRASVTDSTASSAFGAGSSIKKADHSTAVGEGASVNKSNSSFAGGENASITGGYGNIAIGVSSTVSNTFGSSAIGYQSSVTGDSRGMALGTQAKVTDSDRGTALGASASVTNSASASASGNNASVTDSSYAQADGAGAKVTSSKSATAVGNDAIVTNSGSATAVGNGANITNSGSATASGYKAKITDSYQAQAYGTGNSIANSNQASAFGVNSSITSSASGVAIGNNAKLNSAADGIAIGSSADVTSVANGIAIGKNAAVTTANSVALGANSTTSNAVATESATVGSITYGGFVGKSPVGVVSVGSQGKERQITNVAAGQITANSTDAINGSQLYSTQKALGNLASSTSSALGGNSNVQPDGSLSLPTYVITNNPKSPGSTVTVNNVGDALTALDQAVNTGLVFNGNTGNNITKKLGDTLSIKGGLANADAATATNLRVDEENGELKIKLARNLKDLDSVTVGGPTGPSITTNGINAGDKKITNVADGDVSTTSKDAINGSQLNTVKETAEKGWKFTATNGSATSAADTVKPGETLDFANTDGNIDIAAAAHKLNFNLAKDIKVDSVTADGTVVNNNGITIVGGPSVTKTGIDAAGKKITNVAAGTATTDGVNVSQLKPVVDALGGGASLNNDGTIKAPSYTVNNAAVNNVGDAIKALDKGWTVNSNGKLGAGTAVKAGDQVDIGVATGEQNLTTTAKTANGKTVIDFALAKNLELGPNGSVAAGNTRFDSTGIWFAKDPANPSSPRDTNKPAVLDTGIDAGGNKITNVADGDVSTTSKDAINGSQLNTVKETAEKGWNFTATNGTTTSAVDTVKPGETLDFANTDGNIGIASGDNKLTFNLAKNIKVDSVTAGDTVVKNDGITIVGGPSVTKTGIDAGSNKITNVADGGVSTTSKDAINGSQLYNTSSSVANALGGGSVVNPDGTVKAPSYTVNNAAVNNVGDAIKALDKGWTVNSNGKLGAGTAVKAGDQVDIGVATGEQNLTTTAKTANGKTVIDFALAKNLELGPNGSVAAGNTRFDSTGIWFAKDPANPSSPRDTNKPAVLDTGIDAGGNKITNVADGDVSTTSKDAINGSQLNTVKETAEKGWNFTATNGTTTSAVDTVKPGETLDFANTDGNIGIASGDNKLTFNLAKNIKVDSVTAGDTVVKNDGITIVGGPSVTKTGIDAGSNKITNVADGGVSTTSKDAINGSQLYNTSSSVANALGGGSVVNPDGTVKAPSYTVNNAAVNNVGDAIKALDKGWTVNSNGKLGAGTAVKAGDQVDIGVATGEQNLTTTAKTANGKTVIDFALAKNLELGPNGSVAAGNTRFDSTGIWFAKDPANPSSPRDTNKPAVLDTGIDAGGNKITNVADGDVSTTSKDAINGSQLNTVKETAEKGWNFTATNGTTTSAVDTVKPGETLDFANTDGNIGIASGDNKLTFNLAKNIKVDSVTAGDTVVKNDGITIVGGPSVTKTGIDAGSNKITNVADGGVSTTSKDAINGSQLYNTSSSVANALGGGSVVNPDGTVKAPSYTVNNAAVNNVGDAIKALDKGWTVNSNGKLGAGTAVKAGDQVDIGVATGEQNLTTTAETKNGTTVIGFALAKNLELGPNGSVAAGNTRFDSTGIWFAKDPANPSSPRDTNKPAVLDTGIDAGGNKITNVADGDVSTTSKDAINGSQLNTVKETAEKGWNFTATNGTTTSAVDTVKPGETLDFANTDGNIGIASGDNKLTFNLAKNIKVDSVTAGDTVVKNDGITIVGGPSVTKTGINAGDKKITNVLAGDVNDASKDAVNGSQLYKTSSSVANALGGGSVVNPDGTVKAPSYTVNNAAVNNVGDAIKALDKGWTVNADAKLGAGQAVKAGDSVDIGVADDEKNITVAAKTADGKTVIDFALAKDLKVDSVNAGGTVINNNGLSFVDANGVALAKTPSIKKDGIDAGGNKITNVADGGVSTTSKDAINGSQLNTVKETAEKGWNFTATNGTTISAADTVKPGETLDFANTDGNIGITSADNKLTFNLAKDIKVDSVTAGDTVVNNNGITIVGGPSVTKTGINAGDKKITNVLAGDVNDASKDAVNGSQLYKTSSSVANALGGGSVVNPDGTVKAPSYTVNNAAVNNVGDAIKALDKGWTVNADAKLGAGQAVKAGDSVDIGVADDEKNITVAAKTADGKTVIDFALAKDLKVDSVNAGGTVINNNGLSFVDANGVALAKTPSIKKDGIDAGGNKITNVADGGVSTTSKDAINGSQLNTVKETAEKGWNFTATNGTTISAADTVKPGETLDFANTDGNIGITSADNKLTFNLAKDIKVDSVTAGDTVVNNNGITIVGGPSVTKTGIDAAGKKITNVAPGTISKDSKDAINGSQIYNLGNNVTNLFGGNASYDGDHITWNNIGGTGKNNIDDAIKSIGDQAATANKGWNLATDQGTASNVKPNDLVNINGDKASGIVVSNTGNNVTIGLSDKVKVGDKVSIDGTTGEINAGQIKIDGNKGTINNLNNTTWNGPNNIVSGQAATEDQLAQVVNNVNNQTTAAKTEVTQGDNIVVTASKAADGHSIYNVSTAKDVKFDSVTSNVVQVGNVKIDKDGINAGGQKVTNVAAGKVSTTSTDAVNGSQLYGYAEGVKNIIGGTTTYNPETGKYTNSDIGGTGKDNINDAIGAVNNSVINLGDRIDNAFYQTYKRIDKVEKEANAGIASAMAMETAPFIAGKWTYAVGAAYHGGEQAVGATLRKTADNGRWSLTGGVATGTEGDPSVRIGISGVID